MKSLMGVVCVTVVFVLGGPAAAEGDKSVLTILDKAIKALGGEEKLGKVQAMSWEAKGTINLGDNENPFTSKTTFQDLQHFRREVLGEFNGTKFRGVTVVNGDKGWRFFGDNNMAFDQEGLANEKRNVYLQIIAVSVLPLKGKDFHVEAAGEDKVAGKAAALVKGKGPDGKDFKLYFDKESGLPVKQVATVVGFNNMEFTQETSYGKYKDFDGIQRATQIVNNRDGQKFMDQEITSFKLLSKVDAKTFAEPE